MEGRTAAVCTPEAYMSQIGANEIGYLNLARNLRTPKVTTYVTARRNLPGSLTVFGITMR